MQLQTGEPQQQIMLARYYDDKLPRFLSPDPVGGSAGRPQSWNRYSYVLGNPMNLIDPTGMIWAPGTPMPILPGDPNGCTMCILTADPKESPEWQRQAIADYQAIAAMGGRLGQMVQDLMNSNNVHVIKARGDRSRNETDPENEADAMNGKGSGSSIYYDPLSASDADGPRDPRSGLTHELSHAEDIDRGRLDAPEVKGGASRQSEIKAVRMENQYRKSIGDPVRTTYALTYYYIIDIPRPLMVPPRW